MPFMTTRDIINRCHRECERLECAGQGDAANTLFLAARELERLLLRINTEMGERA